MSVIYDATPLRLGAAVQYNVIMPFHSLRTGGAMVVKLAGEEDNTIQLDGRWSHDTLILDMHSRIEL